MLVAAVQLLFMQVADATLLQLLPVILVPTLAILVDAATDSCLEFVVASVDVCVAC
jgi:hypothetical protein